MKSSLNFAKESVKRTAKKFLIFFVVFITLFSFLITPLNTAKAQMPVIDAIATAANIQGTFLQKSWNVIKVLWQKVGSTAFQQVVRSSLNKIAYDTANYLGSGGKGQKPLFVTKDWGAYLTQVGDEAAGSFIENFASNLASPYSAECQSAYQTCASGVKTEATSCRSGETDQTTLTNCDDEEANGIDACKRSAVTCSEKAQATKATSTKAAVPNDYSNNPSFNVCQPSSLEAKVKISMGLVEQTRPSAPNCTASKMVQNWGDYASKLVDFKNGDFLQKFKDIFDPTGNDLGIYLSAKTDMISAQVKVDEKTKLNLAANKGWQDKVNVAKKLVGVPGSAQAQKDSSGNLLNASIGKVTGDIVVDAASVFLNQYAITAFNNLMANWVVGPDKGDTNVTDPQADPSISYGEGSLDIVTSQIIKPDFGVRADYDILSNLSMCADATNPGPTDCVIDNKFMQGISEKKTVAEALKDGYLNGSWQFTKDSVEGAYSLRNIQILRKYRILPVGWEEAVNRIYADPKNPIKVTLMDLVSSFDPNDSYKNFSSEFKPSDQTKFVGLVDPNWVLKAPLNYCKKDGVGSQVLNTTVNPGIPGVSGGSATPSSLNLVRAENYCADEQNCIKEKADGSCEAYGYCNEEKRTWNFSSDSCDPIYNTCQSFTNPISGQAVSYLENTLNYSGCNADTAGCRQYSTFGSFATSTGIVNWDGNKSIYFNKNVGTCNSKDEGCTELIRVKPTWGENLVMDSDFSNDNVGDSSTSQGGLSGWYYASSQGVSYSHADIVDASQEPGNASGKTLKLEASGQNNSSLTIGISSDLKHSLLPENFETIQGYSYTVSADVYISEGNGATIYMGNQADGFTKSTSETKSWQHISVTRDASSSYNEPSFGINANSDSSSAVIYIKNVKFEVSNFEKSYDIYGAWKFYQKILPPYLEKLCYNSTNGTDYSLKIDAPAVCNNFARKCNKSEVGCELFTKSNGITVSGQVTNSDLCPKDCVGYDNYISKEDYFNIPQSENLIPTTATACGAEAVGCSEFTNLDAVSQGGENKEYYSSLKQCIKPNTSLCASFYSWEGTSNGYQLRAYSLQKDSNNNPKVTSDDLALCNATIYNKPLGDSQYNPDCREFYNSAGAVSYHLMARTITCSEDCHAYRMTGDSTTCLNGGTWDAQLKACVYNAIPGEGQSCSAAEKGCREYNGNNGNNVRILSSYNFESGAQGWHSNCVGGLQIKTISNNKDGHSLMYKDSATNCSALGQAATSSVSKLPIIKQVIASDNVAAELNVADLVEQGKSYSLRFIARSDADANARIYFYNNNAANPQKAEFASSTLTIKGGGEWNIYETNLDNLNHAITANEILAISANRDIYFDDIVLTEITDRYYLIKDSSIVPDICYYDTFDKYQGNDYNLGCAQYTDRDGLISYFHKFSKLCSNSSVGCEQMIATQNYSPYRSGIWNDVNKNGVCDADELDCKKVDGDKAIYAVYDSSKLCNSADMGCSRLGQATPGGNDFSDVYKKNNPNNYTSSLCGQSTVGCEAWLTSNSATPSYFKDPGSEACQYRDGQAGDGKAWYKIPVKRCDANGVCTIDNADYPCSVSYLKTFGIGGSGNQVPTPDKQAGLCEASVSGCTEYLDPVSKQSPNLILNSAYSTVDGSTESWEGKDQGINLYQNKVYILSVSGGTTPTVLTFNSGIKQLLNDNNLGSSVTTITVAAGDSKNIIFASLANDSASLSGGEAGKLISIRESIINYQLQENIDKKSCSGLVNSDKGCVLFNERSINGANGLLTLNGGFDAFNSNNNSSALACSGISCNSNQLIKVSPNRTCSKWLDCVTYVQDPTTKEKTCYQVGECTRLDDRNECANFESSSIGLTKFNGDGSNKNASGYYLLNKYQLSNMKIVGLDLPEVHFDFESSLSAAGVACHKADGSTCQLSGSDLASLWVKEPAGAPTDYPAHGIGYLKVPADDMIDPQGDNWIDVPKNSSYYLNFLVNTKNSGTKAKVTITIKDTEDTESSVSYTYSSDDAWSRQVIPFKTSATAKALKISLGASPAYNNKSVYFDDINIEPVLQTGDNQYAARECRMYPTTDSLTCVNKSSNVIKDGLEGYCLEHDPANKNVCLMWYPVDNISSTQLKQTSSGYMGQFPLNYCTEVNGNFDLVKKVAFAPVWFDSAGNRSSIATVPKQGSQWCEIRGTDGTWWKKDSSDSYDNDWANNTVKGDHLPAIKAKAEALCNGNYYPVVAIGRHPFTDGYVKIACVPLTDKLSPYNRESKTISNMDGCNGISYFDGFAKYDSFVTRAYVISDKTNSVDKFAPEGFVGAETCSNLDDQKITDSWCSSSGFGGLNEEANIDGGVRVLNYDSIPNSGDDLKYIANSNPDKNFRLACNNFVQVVNSSGENMAWADRTSLNSAWPTSTPPFFVDNVSGIPGLYSNTHGLAAYGRNRATVPFGAATWSDSDLSKAINLRDQYSSNNNESAFAGRPYGCSNYKDAAGVNGCGYIGYCSMNPDVYCLTMPGDTYISNKTCVKGTLGTCVPLWSSYLGKKDGSNGDSLDYQVILKNIFLKSYGSYKFTSGSYSSGEAIINSGTPSVNCNNNTRADKNAFCYIQPKIDNISVVHNYQNVSIASPISVSKKSMFGLKFTTTIDPEQQPLKEITIDWGDGSIQTISGQDSHPSADNPHVFYHFYQKTGDMTIKISIKDNWGVAATKQVP